MVSHTITRTKRTEMADVIRAANLSGKVFLAANAATSGPLKDGSKLCTLPISEVDDDMTLQFHIAFGEPKWVCRKEVLTESRRNAQAGPRDRLLVSTMKGCSESDFEHRVLAGALITAIHCKRWAAPDPLPQLTSARTRKGPKDRTTLPKARAQPKAKRHLIN